MSRKLAIAKTISRQITRLSDEVAVVTLIAQKNPQLGVFLLTLPVLSIITMVLLWQQTQDLSATSKFAREH